MMNSRFIRIMAVALALLLLGTAALAEVRTTGNVWMRDEPNLEGKQVTSFAENTTLEYLGATSIDDRGVAWYQVTDGKYTGWVSSKYSQLLNEESIVVDINGTVDPVPDDQLESQPIGSDWFTSAAAIELSDYYQADLLQAATALELPSFRNDSSSEVPYQYYNDAVTVAGNGAVEYIGVTGEGYSVFGVAVGMSTEEAISLLSAAGLDQVESFYGLTFEHPAQPNAAFVDEDGHDSNINVDIVDGVVAEIHWSTYTG